MSLFVVHVPECQVEVIFRTHKIPESDIFWIFLHLKIQEEDSPILDKPWVMAIVVLLHSTTNMVHYTLIVPPHWVDKVATQAKMPVKKLENGDILI